MKASQKYEHSCYECGTKEKLKICSEDTAICQKCYDIQVEQAKYFKNLRKKDPQIDQITSDIFLGNEDAATAQSILLQRGITAICVCGTNLQTPFISNAKYSYKIFPVDDFTSAPIRSYFEEHFNWMKSMLAQKRKIMLHCSAGISRSASFAIAYFMREKGAGFEPMLQFIKSKRKYAFPNQGFRAQLREYEEQLISKNIINFE